MICRSRKSKFLALLLPLAAMAAGFLGGIKANDKHVHVHAANGIDVSDFVWDSNSGMHIYQEQGSDPLYAFPNYGDLNGSSMTVYCSGCTEQGTIVQEGPYVFEYTDVTAMENPDMSSQSDELWFRGICTLCSDEHEFSVPQLSGLNYSRMNASFSYFDPEGDSQATYEALPVSAKFFSIGGGASMTYGLAEIDVYQTLAGDRNLMLTETIVLTDASGQETSMNGWSNRFGQTVYINNIQVKTYDDNCTEGWNYVADYGEFFYYDINMDAIIATPTVVKSYYSESKVEIHYKMTAYYGNVVSPYSGGTTVNVITLENASASDGTNGVDISGRWSKTGSSTSSTSVSMTLENVGLREINDGMNYDPDEETFYWYNNPEASEIYELRLDRSLSTLDVDASDQSNSTARVVYTLYNITESQEGTFSSNQPLDFTDVVYNITDSSVTIIGTTSVSGNTLSDVIVHVPLSLITITGLPDPGWSYDAEDGLTYYDEDHPNATTNLNSAIFDEESGVLYLDFYEYYDDNNITLPRETMTNVQITGWTSDGFEVTGTFTTLNTQIDLIVQSYLWNFIGWNYSDGEFLYYEEDKQFETEVTEVTFYEAETQEESVFIFKLNVYEMIWNQETQSSSREYYLSDQVRLHNAVIAREAEETGGTNYITANWKACNIEVYAYPTVTINKDIIENLPSEKDGWEYNNETQSFDYYDNGEKWSTVLEGVRFDNFGEQNSYTTMYLRYKVLYQNSYYYPNDIALYDAVLLSDPRQSSDSVGLVEGDFIKNSETFHLTVKIDRIDYENIPVENKEVLFRGFDYDEIIYYTDQMSIPIDFTEAIINLDTFECTLKGEREDRTEGMVNYVYYITSATIDEDFLADGAIISGIFKEFGNERAKVFVHSVTKVSEELVDPITEETVEQINNAMDSMDLNDDQKNIINTAINENKDTLSDDAGTKIYQAISNTNDSLSDSTEVKDAQKEVVVVVVEVAINVDSGKPEDIREAKRIDRALPDDFDMSVEGEIREFYQRQMYQLVGGSNPDRAPNHKTRAIEPKYKINVDVTDMTDEEAKAHLENEKLAYAKMVDFVDTSVEHMGKAALKLRKCSGESVKVHVGHYISEVKISSFRDFDETAANEQFVEDVRMALMLHMQEQVESTLVENAKKNPPKTFEEKQQYEAELEAVRDIERFENEIIVEVLRQKCEALTGKKFDDLDAFNKDVYQPLFRAWVLNEDIPQNLKDAGINVTFEELTKATIDHSVSRSRNFELTTTPEKSDIIAIIALVSGAVLIIGGASVAGIFLKKRKGALK